MFIRIHPRHEYRIVAFSIMILMAGGVARSSDDEPAYLNAALPAQSRVDDLLSRMTLREKIGQMCQYVGIEFIRQRNAALRERNVDATGFYPNLSIQDVKDLVRQGRIGSFLHVVTASEANELQALARESRLGIPLIIGIDAIHGNGLVRGATVYPAPLNLAATFDDDLVERVAHETALEVRAYGAQWTFSPNVDVARDARWGRTGETFGEDPYLVGRMGAAMVRGYQGSEGLGPTSILACMKHLIAGSEPVNGLNAAPMDVSEHTLRNVFLPPYLACIKEGVGSLMTAHNELNGVPCHANPWLVERLIRLESGFDGFVVSDWMDVERLVSRHRVAADQKEAVFLAVRGGMDMHMHGPNFLEPLCELVKEGRIPETRIDESARRILRVKFALGLFEDRRRDGASAAQDTDSPEHRMTALEAARKSIVLLRNENGLLPLDPVRHGKVLVTGPLADHDAILGDWVLLQPPENVITIREGLQKVAPPEMSIKHFDCGRSMRELADDRIAEAGRLAGEADATIVVVGENSLRYDATRTSGENVDRSDISLHDRQLDLVKAVVSSGKPVVVVLVNSRPIASEWIARNVPALLEAWEPGCMGGQAVAEILLGVVNPSGRLPISIPRGVGHIQTVYNHKPSQYALRYAFGETGPLYAFGHGLSFTRFEYSNLRLPERVEAGEPVKIRVDVQNGGAREGDEVVLLYMNDVVSSVTTPLKELKGFTRVKLAPGERRTVEMTLAGDQLALFNADMKRVVEPGEFTVTVGGLTGRFDVLPRN